MCVCERVCVCVCMYTDNSQSFPALLIDCTCNTHTPFSFNLVTQFRCEGRGGGGRKEVPIPGV